MGEQVAFDHQADYISGRETSPKWMKVWSWGDIGASKSFNINAGHFVNRCFYSYHHHERDIPRCVDAIDGWLKGASITTHGNEAGCRWRYGGWNTKNLKAFLVFSQAVDATHLIERLQRHLRNYYIVLGLASGWQKVNGIYPCCVAGHRSWIVPGRKQQGYFDSNGRWRPPANLDRTVLDVVLAEELGLVDVERAYGSFGVALKKHFPNVSSRCLTIQERVHLLQVVRDIKRVPTDAQKKILTDLVTLLIQGPYWQEPIEIVKTTQGLVFCMNRTKGGSTCAIQAMFWFANAADSQGPWREPDWWNVDPHRGWLNTDPPNRQKGRQATTEIIKLADRFEVRARSLNDRDHYDVKKKEYIPTDAIGSLAGDLIYHLKWDGSSGQLAFDTPISPPGRDDEEKSGCLGLLLKPFD